MNTLQFKPEGWENEITRLNENNVKQYYNEGNILQGLVKECDEQYNLYIKFENGLTVLGACARPPIIAHSAIDKSAALLLK